MPLTYWDSSFMNTQAISKPAMDGQVLRRGDSAESIEGGADVRAFLKAPLAKRTVYKLTPLESSPPAPLRRHDSSYFIQPSQETLQRQKMAAAAPQPLPQFKKPQPLARDMFDSPPPPASKAGFTPVGGASTPVAIPGAVEYSLERRTSLIKAIQAPPRRATPARSLAPNAMALPVPEGSWTARQIRNPDAATGRQPSKLNIRTAQVKLRVETAKAAIKSKADSGPAGKEEAAKELAWRMKFKKKWIKEELYARKQDFPDDPEYTDNWGEALEFIEACGSRGAMQAAFLEGTSSEDGTDSDDEEDLLDQATMFEDSTIRRDTPTSGDSNMCGRAATLLRLHRQATAATAGGK